MSTEPYASALAHPESPVLASPLTEATRGLIDGGTSPLENQVVPWMAAPSTRRSRPSASGSYGNQRFP